MLRVDINLVFTIINLLVLYLLMKKFLFGPVVAVMEKRKAMIEEQFANAAAAEKNANELKSQYEFLKNSCLEQKCIINNNEKRQMPMLITLFRKLRQQQKPNMTGLYPMQTVRLVRL